MTVSSNNVNSGNVSSATLLSDVGSFAIEILKDIIDDENLLHDFKDRLEGSKNWREDMAVFLGTPAISENEVLEVIKLLADGSTHFVMENIDSYRHVGELAMIEIAKVCATKSLYGFSYRINEFNIQNQDALNDLYNTYVETFVKSDARLLIKSIFRIRMMTEPSLIKIMGRIADFRPDLVLEYLDESNIQNMEIKHKIILQCTSHTWCRTWELIKIWMIENSQLLFSIPEFLPENMPKMVQPAPNSDMQKVFHLFKTFAESPKNELIGRRLWKMCHDGSDYKSELNRMGLNAKVTRCGDTASALFISIFGPTDILLRNISFSNPALDHEFDQLWNLTRQNEASLPSANPSYFFAYKFASVAIDHDFVVIQYKDEKNQVKYRILQSWVGEHSLNDYMAKRGNDLTPDEFQRFATRLQFILQEESWTLEAEIFYKQYFMYGKIHTIGEGHLRNGFPLEVKWGMSCFTAMESYQVQFDLFKNSSGIK